MKTMNVCMGEAEDFSTRTANAVILYDELESLLAANHLVDRIPSGADEAVEWAVQSWQFRMLELDCRLEAYRALEEATDAAMVLVALRHPAAWSDLPADWLEYWAAAWRLPEAKLIVMPFGKAAECAETARLIGKLRRWAENCELAFSVFNCGPSSANEPGQPGIPANQGAWPFKSDVLKRCAVAA